MMGQGFFSRLFGRGLSETGPVIAPQAAPAPAPEATPSGIFAANVPLECECGHAFKLPFIGMKQGDEITCPACGDTSELDDDTYFEFYDEFEDAVAGIFEQLGLDQPDDEVVEFVQQHNRIPTAEDLRKPAGYPVGLVGEEFRQDAIRACRVGEAVTLLREPGNPHDPSAIVAVCPRGQTLGYIARGNFVQRVVHEDGQGCGATIWKLNRGEGGKIDVVLDVQVTKRPIGERAFSR